MKLLLLSNSTNFGEEYMQWCAATIANFVSNTKENIVFIPYAAVGFSYEHYTQRVNTALAAYGISCKNIEEFNDPADALKNASAVFVGGGNTFMLLKLIQSKGLDGIIKQRLEEGMPYVGWSAGSNLAGPTICTTNDMPIVEPQRFTALNAIPYQINPHYTDKTIPNHGGESRMQRLQEYISANPTAQVLCLPEASFLRVDADSYSYQGTSGGFILSNLGIEEIEPGAQIPTKL